MSDLPYNLQPTIPDENVKPVNMLDNIPFVLSSKICVNTNNPNCNLEDIKQYLTSVKKKIESGVFNYDFSNDRKLVKDISSFVS